MQPALSCLRNGDGWQGLRRQRIAAVHQLVLVHAPLRLQLIPRRPIQLLQHRLATSRPFQGSILLIILVVKIICVRLAVPALCLPITDCRVLLPLSQNGGAAATMDHLWRLVAAARMTVTLRAPDAGMLPY